MFFDRTREENRTGTIGTGKGEGQREHTEHKRRQGSWEGTKTIEKEREHSTVGRCRSRVVFVFVCFFSCGVSASLPGRENIK